MERACVHGRWTAYVIGIAVGALTMLAVPRAHAGNADASFVAACESFRPSQLGEGEAIVLGLPLDQELTLAEQFALDAHPVTFPLPAPFFQSAPKPQGFEDRRVRQIGNRSNLFLDLFQRLLQLLENRVRLLDLVASPQLAHGKADAHQDLLRGIMQVASHAPALVFLAFA